ncbi:MAG TPA: hypothetical protein VKP30_01835, partial [Polyangiaceae bacterium]|nr:hypothetical protein [Polyangiaceae bacterium]
MVSLPNNTKQRLGFAPLVAIGLFAFACSNDDDSLPLANAAGGPAAGGSNGSAVAGAQNPSGGGASSVSAGGMSSSHYGGEVNSQLGRVVVYSAGRGTPCTVDAAFYQSLSPSDCATVRDLGACVVTSGCSDPSTSAVLASAGDVTLTSAKSALDVKLTPGQGNRYSQGSLTCLSGSEDLNVTATGATVPAFAVDINVPLVL